MSKIAFEGSWVALVTPFIDGKIDCDGLSKLLDLHLDCGTDGIVVCGTTAESPTLSTDEKEFLMEFVAKRVSGRIPLMFGTGGNNTSSAVLLTKRAKDLGADAVLVVTPYYNKPTQGGLVSHFQCIAKATSLPVVLYNVPGRTGVNMLAKTTIELSKEGNIKAVKEASGNLDQMMDIISNAPAGFSLLSGDDAITLPIMALGGRGVISVSGNVAPREVKKLVSLALAGNWSGARDQHYKLLELNRAMFIETNPIPAKAALSMLGLIRDECRLPLVPAQPGTKAELKKILVQMGLLS
ncbi:4-hydroxy-tetrahydrodipicolinate synthase [bacterium]|nr:4-hydroxy-tetrahydrodipicolinate synthase [bacterium]